MRAAIIVISALLAALILGALLGRFYPQWALGSVDYIQPVGRLWLNALQMTIIPLLVALLITGITAAADAARAGRLAARSVIAFMIILWISAIFAAFATPLLLDFFPVPEAAAAALRLASDSNSQIGTPPGFADFMNALIPSNIITAAASDAILPLIIFTTLFAFAIGCLPAEQRAPLTKFFESLGAAMLVIIGWILALAPLGVFALGYVVAVKTGLAAMGGLAHYVVIISAIGVGIWLAGFAVARSGGGISLMRFIRAVIPAHAVAISTQSSLASLPAMLRGAEAIGVPAARADVTLPLAVALFRATGPAMNLAVVIYVAHLFDLPLDMPTLAVGVAVAATTTLAAVSLPGSISFITSIAPIAVAMGVPIGPLVLLVAVETLPDIFRTVGNVTMDVAVTSAVSRTIPEEEDVPSSPHTISPTQAPQ